MTATTAQAQEQKDLLRAVEEENTKTLEMCAATESAILDLRLARTRVTYPRPLLLTPTARRSPWPLVLVTMGLVAALAVMTQPVASRAWTQAEYMPMAKELADIQARGMALLQCRVDRAELICTELADEGDCWVATMSVTGDVFPLLLSTNRAAAAGAIDTAQTTAYRETEILRLDDALRRCQEKEPVEALQQLVDEAKRLRASR